MCAFFGVSRAAYYAWVKRMDQTDPDAPRLQWVQEAYEASHRTYGYRRIQIWLARRRGIRLNHKAVFRLMQKLGFARLLAGDVPGEPAPRRRSTGIRI